MGYIKSSSRCVNSSDVYNQLRKELLLRELSPGSFVDAREKSETYGTSTVPIREALLRLSEAGLIIREKNRGFIVRHFNTNEVAFANDALNHLSRFYLEQISSTIRATDYASEYSELNNINCDPFLLLKQVTDSASKIFNPHSHRLFNLNIDVISTTWPVKDGKVEPSEAGLFYLMRFVRLANENDFPGALEQLYWYSYKR